MKRKYIDNEPKPWPVALQLLVFVGAIVGLFVVSILISEAMLKKEVIEEGTAWLAAYLACQTMLHENSLSLEKEEKCSGSGYNMLYGRRKTTNTSTGVGEGGYREDSTSSEIFRSNTNNSRRKKSS